MRLLLRFVVLNVGVAVLLGACTSARPPVVESRQKGAAVSNARLGMHSKAVLTKSRTHSWPKTALFAEYQRIDSRTPPLIRSCTATGSSSLLKPSRRLFVESSGAYVV
jgi:hypothetical protein